MAGPIEQNGQSALSARSDLSPSPRATEVNVEQVRAIGPLGPYGGYSGRGVPHPVNLGRILRFKWMILLVAFVIAVPALAAVWLFMVPKYRAAGQIRIRPIIPRLVFKTDDNGPIYYYNSYLNTQVAIIMSPAVLQRVLDLPEVQETEWYRKKEFTLIGPPPSPTERLKKTLVVHPRGQTEIVDVAMIDPDPKEAALIVNAVLDHYLMYIRENLDQTDDLMYKKLMEEYTSLRSEIEGREQLAAKLRKDLGTGTPEELISQRRIRLDTMQSELENKRRMIATCEWQLKELNALRTKNAELAQAGTTTQPINLRYENDGEWRKLYLDWRTIRHQIDIEQDRLGESHPKRIELTKRAQLAEELLKNRERYLDARILTGSEVRLASQENLSGLIQDVDLLDRRIKQLKYEEQLLVRDFKAEQAGFERAFDAAQMLVGENEAIKYKREVYEKVRNRLNEKEMERNVPGSIEVLAKATPSSEPEQDRRLLFSILALFGGLGVGGVLAFFRASTNQIIHEADDLHCAVRMPFLGHVPYSRSLSAEAETESAEIGEYIRMIRTALLQRLDRDGGNAILITSACSGAGKSTVAVRLARSLTHCGKKVLLVDADLRKHSLARRFDLDPDPGLLGVLMGQVRDDEAIVKSNYPYLNILPAGVGWQGDDQELLANGAFAGCLERWRKQYDIVLLDSSPILPVADARIICRQMDGVVMVVQKGHCRRSDVIDALAEIDAVGGSLLGTVFIGSSARSYYYYSGNDSNSCVKESDPAEK